jgi:DNA-3-methyladenine glycosylase I
MAKMSAKEKSRCAWVPTGDALYERYHDTEWGVPVKRDRTFFEFLILESAQAGLSWATILKRRTGYAQAFAGFDADRVARFGPSTNNPLKK